MKITKPNFVGRIGFEIECVWNRDNNAEICRIIQENGWKKECDGSIRETQKYPFGYEIKFHYSLDELEGKLPIIERFLSLVQSGKRYGCGSHIHISFAEIPNYFKLANWEFVSFFQSKYLDYAKTIDEKNRIHNHFSEFYKSKEDFIRNLNVQLSWNPLLRDRKPSERYHSINFNSFNLLIGEGVCKKPLETIEFRIFNGTNKISKVVKNINFIIKIINQHLKKTNLKIGIQKETPKKIAPIIIRKFIGVTQ